MQNKTTYRKTEETITAYFREEAASLLPQTEIDKVLTEEKRRISRAETAGIPCRSWMGTNLQRYSKELLRRRQPFFAGYVLLGFCTEVSCALLILYALQWLLLQFTSAQMKTYFSAIPVLLTGYFLWIRLSQAYSCRKLTLAQTPAETLADKLKKFRIVSGMVLFAGIVAILSLFWNGISSILNPLNVSHIFYLYIALILLSGIHNVLYASQCIPFLSIGVFSLNKQFSADRSNAIKWYMEHRKKQFLVSRKKTVQEFGADEALQAEFGLSIRSHIITYRIYIVLALFILSFLVGLCIYQSVKAFTIPVLIMGLVSLFIALLFLAAFLACQNLLHHIRKQP